jgi:hypothetical protein
LRSLVIEQEMPYPPETAWRGLTRLARDHENDFLPVLLRPYVCRFGRGFECRHHPFCVLAVGVGSQAEHGGAVHSTVGVGMIFRSTAMDSNDRFSVALDKLGDFAYFRGLPEIGNARYWWRSKRHGAVTPAPNVAIAAKTDLEKARG